MQLNCIYNSCIACSKTQIEKAKKLLIEEMATNMLERVQFVAGVALNSDEDDQAKKIGEHDVLVEFFVELEETCFICKSHGGKLAMVAHEVEKHMLERIQKRKVMQKEADEAASKKAEPSRPKVVPMKGAEQNSAVEPGPYKPA